MNKLELEERLLDLKAQWQSLLDQGSNEKRELNETETLRITEIRSEIEDTEKQLNEIQAENERLAKEDRKNITENKTERKMGKIKITDLIKGVAEGRSFTEEEARYMKNANTIQVRTLQATAEGAGQEMVPEDKASLDVAIRNASVLSKMGATWFNNAVGDLSLPHYSGSNVAWKGEGIAAVSGDGAFSETVLKPHRLTAYVDLSKQLLAQTSDDLEAIIIRDLAEAIAEKFDKTIMGSEAGTDDKPEGLFYNADTAATIDYEGVLALEEAVEEKNGTNFIFIANPKVKYQLKGTQVASGLQMVYDKNEIDGYKAVVSNSVDGIICMDPRDLAVATWANGVEIVVDATSRAIYNEVRLVVNFLCDAKLRGDKIALTAIN